MHLSLLLKSLLTITSLLKTSHDAYMAATTVAARVAPVIPVIAIHIAMPTLGTCNI